MKKLLSFFVGFVCILSSNAQLVDVIVESFGTSGGTYPAGHTTYRVYARLNDASDFLSAVYGIGAAPADPDHNLQILNNLAEPGSTTSWNSPFGGVTGPDINPAFCGIFPETCFDSFITIGRANSTAPGNAINVLTTPAGLFNPTFSNAATVGAPCDINDGAWFALNGDVNGFPTGVDNRVLIMQVTCPTGELEYQINLQLFDNGNGATPFYYAHNLQSPMGQIGGNLEIDGTCQGLVYPELPACSSVPGCIDVTACNYNPSATTDDGSCEYLSCAGCTDPTACNYDVTATIENGTCTFPGCIDVLACNFDANAGCTDGSCEYLSCAGCTDPTACNYDMTATIEDGTCTYPGCIDVLACNFNANAGCTDGSCEYLSCAGCTDPTACNYDMTATIEDGTCTYPGCIDVLACNFNPNAGCTDGSCEYLSCAGCTDPTACNYDMTATIEDGTCTYPGCTNPSACNYNMTAGCDNGSCEFTSCAGCTNSVACNYDSNATIEDGSCIIPIPNCQACNGTNDGLVIVDADGDGICNANEIPGCTDSTASNYNVLATDDNGSCTYAAIPACDGANGGLEDVIVETYYISDSNDATDADGGSLVAGSTTYRIYIDMAPGYELQAVYGNNDHELRIETTTQFFNNVDRGEILGSNIPDNRIDENTVALDSWVTMGGATTLRQGLLKAEDTNGSLVGGVNNDGGSAGIAGGLLVNADVLAGIPLTTQDGLDNNAGPSVTVVGLDLSTFDNANSAAPFVSTGGAWSVLAGVQGNTPSNRVLVAQITTDGQLSFTLNVQLGTPDGDTEQYVASSPINSERLCSQLTFPEVVIVPGCIDPTACNFNPAANEDNGTCTYPGCTNPTACNYDMTAGCDNGSCAFPGCTNATACNYDMAAGCDDGSCTFPGCTNATACNYDMTAGCDNGSCTFPGCTNPGACNYDMTAGCDDGSCTFPGCTDVTACNYDMTAGCDDGSCTFPGCTNATACNYDMTAGCDDGSCTFPGCTNAAACNYDMTAGCDDGSCTFPGCTNATACNYDMTAGCDDGSCTFPGCTDATACNYDMTAGCDDGSCITSGCTDPTACNYDMTAGCDDGSCTYAPCIANDVPAGAVSLSVNPLGVCSPFAGDLTGASDSPESAATGADLWYAITAVTPGIRIEVLDVNPQNLTIELLDAALNIVETENVVAGNGSEILNFGGLTTGATYYISVTGSTGAISICAQWIQDSQCDFGSGPYDLCSIFKADWIGAAGYAFEFTSNSTNITYSYEKASALQPSTFVKLSDAGLLWNDTYTVNCIAYYNITNGSGSTEKVYVNSGNPCQIIVNASPTMVLRPSDNCANFGPHLLGQTIAGQPFVCGAVDYEWEFTRTDIAELPIYKLRGTANRFIQLLTIPGLTAGGVYDVRVRPIFASGAGSWGATSCLSIVGVVGMTAQNGPVNEMETTKVDVSTMEAGLYPNPNTGSMININLTGVTSEVVNVDVMDQTGRMVFAAQYTVNDGSVNGVITFDQQLAGGVYFMKFTMDGESRTERFVVTR